MCIVLLVITVFLAGCANETIVVSQSDRASSPAAATSVDDVASDSDGEPAATGAAVPTTRIPERDPEPAQTGAPRGGRATIEPGVTADPATTPEPTATVEPGVTADPATTPESTATVEPGVTADPATTPEPTATVEPGVTADPATTPEPTSTPEPTATARPASDGAVVTRIGSARPTGPLVLDLDGSIASDTAEWFQVKAGEGPSPNVGDLVLVEYVMHRAATGEAVEATNGEPLAVSIGDGFVPRAFEAALLENGEGARFILGFPGGMSDLPAYFEPGAYMLLVDFIAIAESS